MIYQLCGDYNRALEHYQQAHKIKEELGDRAGLGASLGSMGLLFIEFKRYAEAFECLIQALSLFNQLESPTVAQTARDLRDLRAQWGAEAFDKAWREKTGQELPELFVEDSIEPSV